MGFGVFTAINLIAVWEVVCEGRPFGEILGWLVSSRKISCLAGVRRATASGLRSPRGMSKMVSG